ncbi:MAG: spiro-SPASM protein [Spirochaetes bacterium]|nr:spiro-SPASM protein [Spirochaetota bacterium]
MKISALLYIDDNLTDDDLTFEGQYLPSELKNRLLSKEIINEVKYSATGSYSGNLSGEKIFIRQDKDDVSFWKKLFFELRVDHIVKIFCDSPFLDMDIIADMINTHTKYLAEFTYSENLPSGFSCEIISKELIDAIPDTDEKTLPLSQVIKSNINKFDVELYYKEPDIRNKRLGFRTGNPREKQILINIFNKAGCIPKYSEVKNIIDRNPDVLYLSPSYVEIELTGKCALDCVFCFRKTLKKEHGDMDTGLFRKILRDMNYFKLPYSVCFGGSGEPLMHNNFFEILDMARNENLIENIIIETNGILAGSNYNNYLVSMNDKRLKTIFNINGMDRESYKAVHNGDFFDTVFRNITSIKEASHFDDSIYIQIMKINETEQFIDRFYDFWEKYKIQIILQKQNTFLNRIEDRSYSDLSPLERTPCWHLQRDFNILSDGSAMFCKQDVDGNFARGNLNKDSISQIFEKSKNTFLNDYKKNFSTSPDCASCSEWYTFNL